MDRLEDRDVPAVWMNLTGDHDAANLANWQFGAYEDQSQLRNVEFDGQCTDPCDGLAGGFDSVMVQPGYTGTVTLGGPVTTWWLYQGGGTIDQPLGSGSEITVLQWWGWDGGTLNSTSAVSSLTLDGGFGTISPTAGRNVELGSDLNFIGGATVTCTSGEGEITVGEDETITPEIRPRVVNGMGNPVAPKAGGRWDVITATDSITATKDPAYDGATWTLLKQAPAPDRVWTLTAN